MSEYNSDVMDEGAIITDVTDEERASLLGGEQAGFLIDRRIGGLRGRKGYLILYSFERINYLDFYIFKGVHYLYFNIFKMLYYFHFAAWVLKGIHNFDVSVFKSIYDFDFEILKLINNLYLSV